MAAGTVVNGVEDAMAVISEIFKSAQHEIVFLAPPSMLSIAGIYDTVQSAKRFVQNGGVLRGIISISRANVKGVRMRQDIGKDRRHSDALSGTFMCIGDKQQSISSINVGIDEYTRDTLLIAFWSELHACRVPPHLV